MFFISDQTSTSNMKIDTLNFLTVLLTSHTPMVLHAHIGSIIPAVVTAVDDSFYKITSEALLVLQYIVKTIRPCKLPPYLLSALTSNDSLCPSNDSLSVLMTLSALTSNDFTLCSNDYPSLSALTSNDSLSLTLCPYF